MAFEKVAERKNSFLRLALSGTAGAGKTYNALQLASLFGDRVGVIDSERGSSQKYAGLPGIPRFFPEVLEDKTIQEYRQKIREAAEARINPLVIDSYSHAWIKALEMVDQMGGASKFTGAWRIVSPLYNALTDAIVSYPGHVIATLRSKADFVLEENAKGKQEPRKVGMASISRDGTDYEFDVMLDLTPEGVVKVSKSRCFALPPLSLYTRDDLPKIARTLHGWLNEGAPISPRDAFSDRLHAARDVEGLDSIAREIKAAKESGALPAEDAAALLPIYRARKAEILSADSGEAALL